MKKLISIPIFILTFITAIICLYKTFVFADNDKSSIKDEIWPKAPNIASDAAILMDASTGTILYEKNINEKHYPASTTKILTAIVAIENSKSNEKVKFSHDAIFSLESGASHIGLVEGEVISMKDSLYALLLASANEAANGIAEHISGSTQEFAKLMNEYAKNIGCTNSNFVNANGLHDKNHYTTCYDLALIAQYAFTNKTFREIDGTKFYTIDKTNKTDETRSFSNHHQMLVGNKEGFTQYKYEYCVGGKTGYTSAADHVLVTYATKNNTTLIAVVMNTSINDQYIDSINLFDYGFDNFTICNLSANQGNNNKEINNKLFNRYYSIANFEDSISINSSSNIIIPNTLKLSDLQHNIEYYDDIKLVEGDNHIGKVYYSYGDLELGSTDITLKCTSQSLTPLLSMPDELSSNNKTDTPKESSAFRKILRITLIVLLVLFILIIILFIVIIIIRNAIIKKKQKNRRKLLREDYYSRTKNRKKNDFGR